MSNSSLQDKDFLPLLPLKNSVLFPGLVVPLSAGRPFSVAAVEAALKNEGKEIIVVAQRDPSVQQPDAKDFYRVGTRAIIRKVARSDSGHFEVLVQGIDRVLLDEIDASLGFVRATIRGIEFAQQESTEIEALYRAVLELAHKVVSISRPQLQMEVRQLLAGSEDKARLAYLLASLFGLEVSKEQALLEARSLQELLTLLHEYLQYESQVLELRNKISSQAQTEINQEQRNYILRRQLEQIQQELGESDPEKAEAQLLREQLEEADLPDEVRKEAQRELKRLERLPAASPEYHTIRTYLSLILELPWNKTSESHFDLQRTKEVLDEDHYDLEEVKERILDQLSVHKLNPGAKAPILCFVGAPGVGKTSLGKSIARALERPFERISLGGLHDEAELRGHRRTYIGAMPGRILQAIRRAGSKDPVLMLDEVDKLGRDFRGDPAAALLEILDPAQNHTFHDNYLDLPFDLSKVFFIGTANTLATVPGPLLDRLEVIRLEGYTIDDKREIARRYLIPRQLAEVGLRAEDCSISDDALGRMITRYTREAGVRQLERTIGKAARKVARRFAEGNTEPVIVRPDDLPAMLGSELYFLEEARRHLPAGVSVGLAWTESGGDVLHIEASLLPKGKGLTLTGQLGDVMQESAKAAQSYVWSHAKEIGIDPDVFTRSGLHVHVPAGAIPKDGPSAGITILTALASLYSGKPVRSDTAMTGEVTLSGLVLPIGGVKEKVLAAQRAGLKRVVLPKQNRKDLDKIPESVRDVMEFVFIEDVGDLLEATIPGLSHPGSEAVERMAG